MIRSPASDAYRIGRAYTPPAMSMLLGTKILQSGISTRTSQNQWIPYITYFGHRPMVPLRWMFPLQLRPANI